MDSCLLIGGLSGMTSEHNTHGKKLAPNVGPSDQ